MRGGQLPQASSQDINSGTFENCSIQNHCIFVVKASVDNNQSRCKSSPLCKCVDVCTAVSRPSLWRDVQLIRISMTMNEHDTERSTPAASDVGLQVIWPRISTVKHGCSDEKPASQRFTVSCGARNKSRVGRFDEVSVWPRNAMTWKKMWSKACNALIILIPQLYSYCPTVSYTNIESQVGKHQRVHLGQVG